MRRYTMDKTIFNPHKRRVFDDVAVFLCPRFAESRAVLNVSYGMRIQQDWRAYRLPYVFQRAKDEASRLGARNVSDRWKNSTPYKRDKEAKYDDCESDLEKGPINRGCHWERAGTRMILSMTKYISPHAWTVCSQTQSHIVDVIRTKVEHTY